MWSEDELVGSEAFVFFSTTSRVWWSMSWIDWSKLLEIWPPPHVVRGRSVEIWQVSGSWLSGSEEVEKKHKMQERQKLGEDKWHEELIHGKDCHTSNVTVALRTVTGVSSNRKSLWLTACSLFALCELLESMSARKGGLWVLIAAETREEKQRHCVRFNPSVSRHSFKMQLFDTLILN